MDIVTFALCKKMTQGGGGTSAEVQQQIDEIKKLIEQIEVDKEEYDIKLSSIEEKINAAQTDRILTELQEVRNELALKVSAVVME